MQNQMQKLKMEKKDRKYFKKRKSYYIDEFLGEAIRNYIFYT
jgi:hypothetical protein